METASLSLEKNALLARDMLCGLHTDTIPTAKVHLMDIPLLEEIAGYPAGAYQQNPEKVYLAYLNNAGICFIDQYIPRNPLTMTQSGFRSATERHATTGAQQIEIDGIVIDSPEAVVQHLESHAFPELREHIVSVDEDDKSAIQDIIDHESNIQNDFGPNILKAPYGISFNSFPQMRYTTYGYANYLMAFVMYPDIMDEDFRLQADLGEKLNRRAVSAMLQGDMVHALRLDHDMADSSKTLVDIQSLDAIWFPHFARAIAPYAEAGIRLIWHCDGNLMDMVPRLIEAGISGFQGFQYECGMDYPAICRMRSRNNEPLLIWAGVSVTTTLPNGTPDDVKKELKWLVENGPREGLALGASSSVAPGTNRQNVRALLDGLKYYREKGRP